MNVTVVEILDPRIHLNGRIFVQTRTGQRRSLATGQNLELYDRIQVGDKLVVVQRVNDPYVHLK